MHGSCADMSDRPQAVAGSSPRPAVQAAVALALLLTGTGVGCAAIIDAHFDRVDPKDESAAGGGAGAAGGAGGAGGAIGTGGDGAGASGGGAGGGCVGPCQPPTQGMLLWLRSDEGLTGSAGALAWHDQVTNTDAIAGDPPGTAPKIIASSAPFNHHAVVRFDGIDDRVRLPDVDVSFDAGFTAALVLRTLGKSWYDGVLFFGAEAAGDTFTNAIAIGRENDWDRIRFTVQGTYDPAAWWTGIVQMSGGITTAPEHAEIVVVVQRPDNATVWFYLDGRTVAKSWGDAALPPPGLRDASFLGWVPNAGFKGDVAEAIAYNRAVDDAERASIEAYLSEKYAVPLATPCTSGCPEVLATKQGIPTYLAAFGSRVVWTNNEGGEVMTIDDVTATPPTVHQLAGGPSSSVHPTAAAVDASHVYWGDEAHIHRVPVGGGPVVSTATSGAVQNVAIDADTVYGSMSAAQAITIASKGGWPTSTTLPMLGKVGHVATDGTDLYWSQLNDAAVDGVFRSPEGAILPAGGGAEQLGVGWSPSNIVIDDAYVFFELGTALGASLQRVDKADPGASTGLVEETGAGGLFVSDPDVYYTSPWDGAVKRIPRSGGAATTIATGQSVPNSVVVVGDWVVWSNLDGTVVRAPKPP